MSSSLQTRRYSIGLASFPEDRITGADSFVALADQALYRAKNEGRNLVRQ